MTGNAQPVVDIPDEVKKWRQDVEKGGEWEEWYVLIIFPNFFTCAILEYRVGATDILRACRLLGF